MTAAAPHRLVHAFPAEARVRQHLFPSCGVGRVVGIERHPACGIEWCVLVDWPHAAGPPQCAPPASLEIVEEATT